jgi:uncharacterized protein (DUF1501 family)
MNASRRHFIGQLGTGLAACAFGGLAPRLFAAGGKRGAGEPRAFILIQLEGGHDGLTTFAPWQDDDYRRQRPSLAVGRSDLISLGADTGLHRAGRGLEPLFKDGRLAVVQNVGLLNQSPSHFRATEIWQTASEADEVLGSGWLGRCATQLQGGSRIVTARYGGRQPRVLAQEQGGAQFGLPLAQADALGQLAEIGECAATSAGAELYFVSVPGFDTHFDQAGRHAARLQAVADALLALQRRLAWRGVDGRVLTMVFSEFGRSPAENAQGGTDHGGGGPVLLLGRPVCGGFHNSAGAPAAGPLDFRRVLATVADRWLQVSPAAVLGRNFEHLDILA